MSRMPFPIGRRSVHARNDHLLLLLTLVLVLLALTLGLFPRPAYGQTGVQFDGSNDHIALGAAPSLGTATFTLETWFMRTGPGVQTTTGTGGVTNAVPLLTKGRGEAEASTVDMNWFLGIRGSDSLLVADYEEGTGQTSPGLNHPVVGVTPLRRNVWYHAAATFDGTTWRLYLNGVLENTVVVGAGRLPQSASIQHAAMATALNSTGVAAGYFAGVLDEPRVWDHARPGAGIADSMGLEFATAPGLLGRWGLNEGTGTVAGNSAGTAHGTLVNGATWVAGSPFALANAVRFNGGRASFGVAPELGLAQFTIETWFRRDAPGTTANTGTGGVLAVPLVTKGVGEAEASTVDMNWFLGIRGSDGVLAADFEEGATGASPGLNHPVVGVTPIATGTWHHAAATYDGATWALYLDGVLEASVAVGQPPQSASIQHAGLAAALNSTGVASGSFVGVLDEVRVWDHARTQAEILAAINTTIESAPGLVGRWGLDEGAGAAIAGTGPAGSLIAAYSWTGPAPFDAAPPGPPAPPFGLVVSTPTHALARLTWSDASNNEAGFSIEQSTTGPAGPFTPIAGVAAGATTFEYGPLTAGSEYCWRVLAFNGTGSSAPCEPACATMPVDPYAALDFSNGHVTFGVAPALGLSQFTIEAWIRRDGAGLSTSTGSGGVDAVPLVTKGRAEADGSNVDMNWFLGIQAGTDVLAADFEEAASGATPGLNHPVTGITPIGLGTWHHVAVTYGGGTWRLYLDGNLDRELAVGAPPQFASIQHAALGAAMTSTGVAAGAFHGALDEVRVWNLARSQTQIQSTANARLAAVTPGLVARWALDEGWGTTVAGSAGTAVDGSVVGSADWFGPGAPFDLDLNLPPHPPLLLSPVDGEPSVPPSPELTVVPVDPDGDPVTVRFFGRPAAPPAGDDFTIVKLPDTQYYTSQQNGGTIAMFEAQTNWIVANRLARNIVAAVQVGDCTEHGDNGGNDVEWVRADQALSVLEDPLTTGLVDGVPYGVCVGNHDQSPIGDADGTTTFYNQYFGAARFAGRGYYGGHYGANNDNHYELFSGGGMDFVLVCLEYDTTPDAAVLAWAEGVLAAHPARHAIVATHNLIGTGNPGAFSTQGQAIYDALKDQPNLVLMLGGHVAGEGRRSDVYQGRTVHSLLADFQSRANGGSGWLRLLEFSPALGVLRVRTYSPWLDQWEADADSSSQFTLAMDLAGNAPFTVIDSVAVPSGIVASVTWPSLDYLTDYEWFAQVDDGAARVDGPVWSFTTQSDALAVDGLPAALELAPVHPNPVRGAVRFRFALPEPAQVRLRVLDLAGREVASLTDDRLAAGRHTVEWKGSMRGRPAAPGVYLVRLDLRGGASLVRRFIVLR